MRPGPHGRCPKPLRHPRRRRPVCPQLRRCQGELPRRPRPRPRTAPVPGRPMEGRLPRGPAPLARSSPIGRPFLRRRPPPPRVNRRCWGGASRLPSDGASAPGDTCAVRAEVGCGGWLLERRDLAGAEVGSVRSGLGEVGGGTRAHGGTSGLLRGEAPGTPRPGTREKKAEALAGAAAVCESSGAVRGLAALCGAEGRPCVKEGSSQFPVAQGLPRGRWRTCPLTVL
uniref:Bcl-2-binding component 3-like n=1 Tax=Phascolarctos cinereus TaxID=38626 RepID=A0A6P5LZH4_PHACI|nr:bcl-2-binding component 3-like [Phascolarctos cinereus]